MEQRGGETNIFKRGGGGKLGQGMSALKEGGGGGWNFLMAGGSLSGSFPVIYQIFVLRPCWQGYPPWSIPLTFNAFNLETMLINFI